MEPTVQERAIHALTLAIGIRLRLCSPITLATALEDLLLCEAARAVGMPRDVLTSRPPQLLRKRPGLVHAYHVVLEGFLVGLASPPLNTAAWWAEVNRGVAALGGSGATGGGVGAAAAAGGGGGVLSEGDAAAAALAPSFFEHYRPRGETWAAAAERGGGLAL